MDVPMYIEEVYPPVPPAGVDQQNPSASLRHKHTFVEMAVMSRTKGYPFNTLRPDRAPNGCPWLSGLAVRPGAWAVNLKMVEEVVALNQQVHLMAVTI